MTDGGVTELPASAVWLNSPRPLSFQRDLRGRVVLLHFWTYHCIHCVHTLRDIEHLRRRFADQPFVVIGVHADKYHEDSPRRLSAALERLGIDYPVIADHERTVWHNFDVTMWPTFVLIGADGKLVGVVSGEDHGKLLETAVQRALVRGGQLGILATDPLPAATPPTADTPLRFPGKVLADAARLVIVDTGHHRVLITSLPDDACNVRVQHTIGAGVPGAVDGPFADASFNRPQGATLRGEVLWIADTDNHLVRRADLRSAIVTTVLGTGEKLFDHEAGKSGREQGLNSPWDLAVFANRLYLSQAGQHQIFAMNLMTGATEVAAGTAREDLRDGGADAANLAQPSGLALDAATQTLYFADAQSSALRALDLREKTVRTLIGAGLFEFGDIDGPADAARLKHPLGVAHIPGAVFIADSANHKIKHWDPQTATLQTVPLPANLEFFEPASVAAVSANELFIADIGNHRIVRINTLSRQWQELQLNF